MKKQTHHGCYVMWHLVWWRGGIHLSPRWAGAGLRVRKGTRGSRLRWEMAVFIYIQLSGAEMSL